METGLVMVMWVIWGVLAVITLALYAYRSTLARDEDAQVFLDEAFAHEKALQTQIVARINKINPAVHVSLAVTGVMTAFVIGYYVLFAYRSLFS